MLTQRQDLNEAMIVDELDVSEFLQKKSKEVVTPLIGCRSIPAPNLCNVAIKILEPAVERFNSRSQRERIRLRLQKVAHDGKLNDILRIVNNSTYIENDRTAYRRAVKEFVRSVLQMQQLTFEKTHKKQLARAIGSEVSASRWTQFQPGPPASTPEAPMSVGKTVFG